ncbi:MAG: glycosyltransferase [Thermoplasmataceae archaeon]
MKIAALIVTHNPDNRLFQSVYKLVDLVDIIILIDNNSSQRDVIEKIKVTLPTDKFTIINLTDNFGIAYALNAGVRHIQSLMLYDYAITLDQDTILLINNLKDIVERANKFQPLVGAIELPERVYNDRAEFVKIESSFTSGKVVSMEVYKSIKYREDFFLDQIDLDFDFDLKKAGYTLVAYNIKSIDHKLGVIGRNTIYEPGYRLYYIVRNSTTMLIEGKIEFKIYISQIRYWTVHLFKEKGLYPVFKPFTLGFLHGVYKKLGKNSDFVPR